MAMSAASAVQDIEAKAEALLDENGFGERIPLPIVDLCKLLDIQVLECAFVHDDVHGIIVGESGRYTIYVRRGDTVPRKRFTIAHELGHHQLHLVPNGATDVGYKDTASNLHVVRYLSTPGFGQSEPVQEREANAFATALLMPARQVELAASISQDHNVLAGVFGVAPKDMAVRLREVRANARQ